ncbi:ribonuclease T2-like protein [Flagelloscypha sp. PMI_526]|nr:ribonuclease T2-like protein [Flagelloscypha sp. PMI_526]
MVLSIILAVMTASAGAKPLSSNGNVLEGLLRREAKSCDGSAKQSCEDGKTGGTCCFEAPGGLLMQTQFWDTNPVTGPDDSWTIHGLWPDNCDGTFSSNCDPDRAYNNIASLLSDAGANSTLSFMKDYWQDINGDDESFWEHEWGKHGTCMSTFEADCFPGSKGAEAVAFFETTVSLFKNLTTYDFLKDAGIEPSSSKTYSYSEIKSALSNAAGGVDVQVSCEGSQLNSVAYYFNIIGSPVNGNWVPVDALDSGSCPSKVSYTPKSGQRSSARSIEAASKRTAQRRATVV